MDNFAQKKSTRTVIARVRIKCTLMALDEGMSSSSKTGSDNAFNNTPLENNVHN